jgi:hypothetical protein
MNYLCNICNKEYKSYGSLWNHNKLKHNNVQITQKIYKFQCTVCNKKFTRKSNLDYHNTNCCKKEIINDDNNTLMLKQKIIEMEKKIESLENKNNIINNGTINNGTINNINNTVYINKTGSENVLELNDSEKNEIFNKELSGIVSFIKFINFNERLPNNHSFCTKSLEGKYLLSYNTEEEKIESIRKKYFYQELLNNSVEKMEILYKSCKNNFSKEKQLKVESTIQSLKEIRERDFSNKVLKEIKNKLIEISYNLRATVLNTWNNPKNIIKPNIKNTDDEDEKIIKELSEYNTQDESLNYFIMMKDNLEEYNSESEDSE